MSYISPYVYKVMIDDPYMSSDIINFIDGSEDQQNHKTHAKALMTSWDVSKEKGFDQLCVYVQNAVYQASLNKYGEGVLKQINKFDIVSMWGLKYSSEDFATEHTHYPSLWSGCFYLNVPENCPNIEFLCGDTVWREVPITNGLLIIFEGNTMHRVRKTKFDGYRYAVSFNICENRKLDIEE